MNLVVLDKAPYKFSPLHLSGCLLWLDATRITGLADNDPVGTWPDLSGNGRDPGQGTAAKKPTFKTGILNGQPVVRFDGVDDTLATAASGILPAAHTVFVVFRPMDTTTVPQTLAAQFGAGDGRMSVDVRSDGGSGRPFSAFEGGTGHPGTMTGTAMTTTGTAYVGTHRRAGNGAAINGYLNGASSYSAASGPNPPSNTVLTVGGNSASSQLYNGDIAELIAYNSALSDPDRTKVRQYLARKWGIAGALS